MINGISGFLNDGKETQRRIFEAVASIITCSPSPMTADRVAHEIQSALIKQGSRRVVQPFQMIPILNQLVELGYAKRIETPQNQPELWVSASNS